MPETEPIDIYPDPPAIALYSYIGFAAFGILHLVLAALFDCLQMLNLVLGLLEILIAIWIFVEVSRWQKKRDAWRRSGDKTPPPTAAR
jgi:hypothetical protein